MNKKILACSHCGLETTPEKSEVQRINKSSNLTARYCHRCLDQHIIGTSHWKFPFTSKNNFDTYIELRD